MFDETTYKELFEGSIRQKKTRLRDQLTRFGFGVFEISQASRIESIREGIDEISGHEGFRFPPINVDHIEYKSVHQEAFKALFEIALEALYELTDSENPKEHELPALFSSSANEPFPEDHPFHPSFFNLFNYDHGSLNEHLDRGLITVIFVDPANRNFEGDSEDKVPSALWIKGADDLWRSGDHLIRELRQRSPDRDFVLILVGEDGEAKFNRSVDSSENRLFAASHSVRANPTGAFIERSHHRCDPAARPNGNRKSAALILKQKALSEH